MHRNVEGVPLSCCLLLVCLSACRCLLSDHHKISSGVKAALQSLRSATELLFAVMQPGAGTAVATTAQIVERLAYGRTAAINTHLAKANLLPRLFDMCFAFPFNNVIQSACCGTLRSVQCPSVSPSLMCNKCRGQAWLFARMEVHS